MNTRAEYPALLAGVVSISFAAVFIRLADAPAPAVAALRLLFSTALLAPYVLASKQTRAGIAALGRARLGLLALSGLFLAAHFLAWIASLSLTGITSSVVFVTTSPLFVALYSATAGRERIGSGVWTGLAIALAGGALLGGGNIAAGAGNWKGDLLALCGAVAVAGYFIVGSRLRRTLPLIVYVFPVYATAAVLLTALVPLFGASLTGLSARSYIYTFLMALLCQVGGHSLLNWALVRIQAAAVAAATLGEPVGAAFLAWLVLGEAPVTTEVAGGAVILLGIYIVLRKGPAAVAARGGVMRLRA